MGPKQIKANRNETETRITHLINEFFTNYTAISARGERHTRTHSQRALSIHNFAKPVERIIVI